MDKHEFYGTVRSPGCGLGRVLVYHDETFGLVFLAKRKKVLNKSWLSIKNTPTFFVNLGTLHIDRRMNWGG